MREIEEKFDVDLTDLNFRQHFNDEGFNPIHLLPRIFKPASFTHGGLGDAKKVPIKMSDFYLAAKLKKWPIISNRKPV